MPLCGSLIRVALLHSMYAPSGLTHDRLAGGAVVEMPESARAPRDGGLHASIAGWFGVVLRHKKTAAGVSWWLAVCAPGPQRIAMLQQTTHDQPSE